MVMQSFGVTVQSQMQGGFMSALKRSALGGESFFITTFIGHPQSPTWVDVAARLPGDATVIECRPDRGLVLTKGAWLASEMGVKLDTKWGGGAMLFGGEGGFIVHCTGQGKVIAGSFGALDLIELPPGRASPSTPGTWSPTTTACRSRSARWPRAGSRPASPARDS